FGEDPSARVNAVLNALEDWKPIGKPISPNGPVLLQQAERAESGQGRLSEGALAPLTCLLKLGIGYHKPQYPRWRSAIWAVRLSSAFVEPFAAWMDRPARIDERYRV